MSEQENPETVDEFTMLKLRADTLGIRHSNNIGLETLRKKVNDAMNTEINFETEAEILDLPIAEKVVVAEKELTASEARHKMMRDAKKLVRVRITNMDPKKASLPGEILTVANEYIGTVSRYVPFGEVTDEGWHVEQCIYDMMNERRFLHIRVTKDARGREVINTNWAREFSLEVLPPLTKNEIEALKTSQAAEGAVG